MNSIDKKIKKICERLEKEFNAKVVCGEAAKGKEKTTIPVSIKESYNKDQEVSSYNQPIGLIEISGGSVKFVSTDKTQSILKTIIKIIIIIISVLGFKNLFKSKKKWDSD